MLGEALEDGSEDAMTEDDAGAAGHIAFLQLNGNPCAVDRLWRIAVVVTDLVEDVGRVVSAIDTDLIAPHVLHDVPSLMPFATVRALLLPTDAAAAVGNVFYFDYDSSTLKPQAQAALDAHIALLRTNDRSVRLEGHTDERGTREYNMALGERRANTVRDYMVVNGIPSFRIETVSYGEEQPIAYGSSEANWSQNRRVELK